MSDHSVKEVRNRGQPSVPNLWHPSGGRDQGWLECRPEPTTNGGHERVRIRRGELRDLRISRGWTQDELASLVGCSRSSVATWETTGRPPRPNRLNLLAGVLGVPVSRLIEPGRSSILRRLRTSAGLLQKDVAFLLNVGAPTYCDVETGRQEIPERWIPILSKRYGVTPNTIRDLPKKDATSS
ncbi:helix-turn-helix domain-containing protein [Streptomyces sp. NPDC090106]|uniref:helix-turn-helix domain-containing protein n=1 Tax=Streptomyces sp. NPDC090106 TaxID=3365946 RepID=UPI00381664E7